MRNVTKLSEGVNANRAADAAYLKALTKAMIESDL